MSLEATVYLLLYCHPEEGRNDTLNFELCTVVVLCVSVCQCVQASHPLLTQLQDQVDIPMDSVSCSLQNEFGVFRLVSKIAIALPYSR